MPTQIRKRTIKAPDARRADLLAAAARVLAGKGVDEATVEDIATAAGVAKGTFYLYFASKEEILDALRRQFVDAVAAHLTELRLPGPGGDWRDLPRELVRRSVALALEHRDLHRVIARVPRTHNDAALEHARDATVLTCERMIRAGMDAGAYRVADPAATAMLLFALIHAACDEACDHPAEVGRIIDATSDIVSRALIA